ncbi:3486_t:CDS:2 [Funneliformis geosporum]|nr:3486_t:CDS:2 [Funneliformis geosporum]
MNNPENKLELTLKIKIHKLREIIENLADLEQKESNQQAGNMAYLLKMITDTFEDALKQTLLSSESGVGISAKSVGIVLERMIEALQEITEYLEKNQSHEI